MSDNNETNNTFEASNEMPNNNDTSTNEVTPVHTSYAPYETPMFDTESTTSSDPADTVTENNTNSQTSDTNNSYSTYQTNSTNESGSSYQTYEQPYNPTYDYSSGATSSTSYGASAEEPSNGFAIASLVLGILGLLFSCCCGIGMILSILGLVFGCLQPKNSFGKKPTMAIVGIVLSAIGLAGSLLIIVGSFLSTDLSNSIRDVLTIAIR